MPREVGQQQTAHAVGRKGAETARGCAATVCDGSAPVHARRLHLPQPYNVTVPMLAAGPPVLPLLARHPWISTHFPMPRCTFNGFRDPVCLVASVSG